MTHNGPSHAALVRLNRVLLCLVDANCDLTVREIIDRLSEYMTRADAESAIRRLSGSQQIVRVPGSRPAQWRVTTKGLQIAGRLIGEGSTY